MAFYVFVVTLVATLDLFYFDATLKASRKIMRLILTDRIKLYRLFSELL